MIRYIHGSEDSTDLDVIYVFEELPSIPECQQFAQTRKEENINIITIREGTVSACWKGHPDEVNNALFHTYSLHHQTHPLVILRQVSRDAFLKDITVTRKILSVLTRSSLRARIKEALRGDWHHRLAVLGALDFSRIDTLPVRGREAADAMKSMAFSLGQAMGLHAGRELYTKSEIADFLPELAPYLYRSATDYSAFQQVLSHFLQDLSAMDVIQHPNGTVSLAENGATYHIYTEQRLS